MSAFPWGKRITRAADDPAGLAISEGVRSQIIGLSRGAKNANDAMAILNTAEGVLSTLSEITIRMKELAVQASNGTLADQERSFLQTEVDELFEEYGRLVRDARFNELQLLDGSLSSFEVQLGDEAGESSSINLGSAEAHNIFTKAQATGAFEESTSFDNKEGLKRLQDVNNDGRKDLVRFDRDQNQVGVSLADGSGEFLNESISNLNDFIYSESSRFIDLNADGHIDILSIGSSGIDKVVASYGDGQGNFSNSETVFEPGENIFTALEVGDVDGDGNLDFVTNTFFGSLRLHLGDGQGNYEIDDSYGSLLLDGGDFSSTTTSFSDDFESNSFELVDYDQDGDLDIINYYKMQVLANDGSGSFSISQTWGNGFGGNDQGASGDFDGDGDLDLAIHNQGSLLEIRLQESGFNDSINLNIDYDVGSISVQDINSDGFDDLLVTDTDRDLHVYLSDGEGNFEESDQIENAGIALAYDFNGDEVLDILGETTAGGRLSLQRTLAVNGVDRLDVTTQRSAQLSLATISSAQENLAEIRAQLSSQQNKLRFAANNNLITIENLESAKSQILDTDFAQETAELVRTQILQQAQTAVLSQANSSLSLILQLLR